MASKVHPRVDATSTSYKQEVFTVWMKSLILNTNGCTVFDSNGEIAYRVDNYDHKCSSPVYIMDAVGDVLFTITKKLSLLGVWKGYKSANKNRPVAGFRVVKMLGIKGLMGCTRGRHSSSCKVKINGFDEYVMKSEIGESSCKIFDKFGVLAAEVKRKIGGSGVVLGEDVLAMVVEPRIDHTLIVGLVVVFGLMHHIL